MRISLLLPSIFLFSALTSAHAASSCPELTGEYICRDQSGQKETWDLSISQSENDGVTFYNDETDDFKTDSKTHSLDWDFFRGHYVSDCSKDSWSIELSGIMIHEGKKFADLTDEFTYTKTATGDLTLNYNYKRLEKDGSKLELKGQAVCERIHDEDIQLTKLARLK